MYVHVYGFKCSQCLLECMFIKVGTCNVFFFLGKNNNPKKKKKIMCLLEGTYNDFEV